MKKRIYLLRHKHVPNWVYVGATSEKYLSTNWSIKWCNRHQRSTKLSKALRCSERSDWEVTQLHPFSEYWENLERRCIYEYNSFDLGLNSTASGAWEATQKLKTSAAHTGRTTGPINGLRSSKRVICETGMIYPSAHEAARQTGIRQTSICRCCRGNLKTAGGLTWRYV